MNWKVLSFLIVFLAGASWFGVALAEKVEQKQLKRAAAEVEGKEKAAAASIVKPPKLVSPEPAQGPNAITLTGTLEPEASVEVAFRIPGRVISLAFRRGDTVAENQPMAVLETPDIGVQDAQARAALKVAIAQKNAAADALRRTRKLTDAGVGTEQQLALVEGQATVSSAAIAQAVAAGGAVDALRAETFIVAPMAGVITKAPTSAGFLANPGAPIFTIQKLSTLRFVGHISERDAVKVPAKAEVTVESEAGRVGKGAVSLVLGSIDAMSYRVPIEALIDNTAGSLFAGSLVNASIAVPAEPLLALPMTTLLTGEEPAVLVVGPKDILERRSLTVADTHDGRILVRTGIERSDKVVDSPGTAWRAGDTLPPPTIAKP